MLRSFIQIGGDDLAHLSPAGDEPAAVPVKKKTRGTLAFIRRERRVQVLDRCVGKIERQAPDVYQSARKPRLLGRARPMTFPVGHGPMITFPGSWRTRAGQALNITPSLDSDRVVH